MRIAQVVGHVTLSASHPALSGARLRLVVPLSLAELLESSTRPNGQAEPLVAYDELGSGLGSQVLLSEGPEAAQPFRPELKPVDAYIAGILDTLHVRTPQELLKQG